MNIQLFFDPLEPDLLLKFKESDDLFSCTKFYTQDTTPNYDEADIVIVGVPEIRGGISNFQADQSPNVIREHLYGLKLQRDQVNICDLGNLRTGDEREDTIARLQEIAEIILEAGKLLILLGGTQDLDFAQFKAYDNLHPVSLSLIDSQFDLEEYPKPGEENLGHTREILLSEPNNLLAFSAIGYQSYLVSKKEQNTLEKLHGELIRIGKYRDNPEEIEPTIRNSHMVSFDVSAIKSEFATGTNHPFPFGFTGEEACQIAWYAGNANELNSFGIYEYNPNNDPTFQTAKIIGVMIWYLVEGYYNRKTNLDFDSPEFTKYVVPMPTEPGELTFYKHKSSEKWWMKVQYSSPGKAIQTVIAPCSYEDFQKANDAEIPDRWILTNARYS